MKRIALLALALILMLSLAACSGNTGNDTGNNIINPPTSQNRNENNPGSGDPQGNTNNDTGNNSTNPPASQNGNENNSGSGDPQGNTNLISIGTTATATFTNRYDVKHSVSICVEEVIRGEAALSFINDSMMAEKKSWSAQAPEEADQEYIVAKITYSLLAYDDGDERSVTSFYAYSGTFEAYPSLVAAMFYDKDNNYPELSHMDVKVGETVTAYEIFQISKADPSPSMTYCCYSADLSDGLWFKLY